MKDLEINAYFRQGAFLELPSSGSAEDVNEEFLSLVNDENSRDTAQFLSMLGYQMAKDAIDLEEYKRRLKEFLDENPRYQKIVYPGEDKMFPLATVAFEPRWADLDVRESDFVVLDASNREELRVTVEDRLTKDIDDSKLLAWFVFLIQTSEEEISNRKEKFREDQFGISNAYGTSKVIDKGTSRERKKNRNPFKRRAR